MSGGKTNYGWSILAACCLATAVATPSMAKPWWDVFSKTEGDCHALVGDTRGVKAGDPVTWRGLEVGHVARVKADKGLVRIDIELGKEYRGKIPVGVKAWPNRNILTKDTSLLLVDKSAPDSPSLARGAEIPTAALHEVVTRTHLAIVGGVIVVVVVVILILKGIKKLIFLAVILALFGGGFGLLKAQWRGESGGVDPAAEAEALIEKLQESPKTRELATRLKGLLADAAASAREEGPEAWAKLREQVTGLLDSSASELRDGGEAEEAGKVGRLKELVAGLFEREKPKAGDGE